MQVLLPKNMKKKKKSDDTEIKNLDLSAISFNHDLTKLELPSNKGIVMSVRLNNKIRNSNGSDASVKVPVQQQQNVSLLLFLT